ncbi:MAG TPA: hypothetical protein VLD65_03570 [Anaerolineales bacterium]|nr:hypothetical protein [Anaerolineales bacterium]
MQRLVQVYLALVFPLVIAPKAFITFIYVFIFHRMFQRDLTRIRFGKA